MTQPLLHAQQSTDRLPEAPSALHSEADASSDVGAAATDEPAGRSSSSASASTSSEPPTTSRDVLPLSIAAPVAQPLLSFGQPSRAAANQATSAVLPPCPKNATPNRTPAISSPTFNIPSCEHEDQLQLIVDVGHERPLTSGQKGVLAIRAVIDPFNLLSIAVFSGVAVGANAHTVYGPGLEGWGRLSGYSLAEDMQSQFTGVYVLPSLFHEDPRYHRMPGAPVALRIKHALIHTFVSQHDDGSLTPNYATLINYPLSAEITNLYVPGISTNVPSTAKRIAFGYLTDPVGPLLAEFLPDFAKRVHIHILFAQQILNHIALGSGAQEPSL